VNRNKYLCIIVGSMLFTTQAQRKDLNGVLLANDDVEGIHILNKTAVKYTVSDEQGNFIINAKAQDTLTISGLKYLTKTIIITEDHYAKGLVKIALVERINELNEVVLGTLLTGSLESDLENSKTKPDINFYDLGIPGYKGIPLTQNERRLHDADAGSWGHIGLGFGLNFHKLLNLVSGRTKKLKHIVALEYKNKCLERIRNNYESLIFTDEILTENLKDEFFYFCDEDSEFTIICNENNDLKMIDYLKEKLIIYKNRLISNPKKQP